jgi:hypothetical protein
MDKRLFLKELRELKD